MRILVLILALLFAIPAWAQTRLDSIVSHGVLRVGMPGDYQPFAVLDKETGTYSGLDVEMAERLAASLNVQLQLVPTSWATLLSDLAADKFDVGMGGISITLPRQQAAFFSAPLLRTGKAAIAPCWEIDKFLTLQAIDKPDVKVIVNPGGTNEKFDRDNLHKAQIIVYPDNTKIFDALADGEADVMITDAVEAKLQEKQHQKLCAIHPNAPLSFSELGYLLPRDIALKLYVDQWLHELTQTGAWETLRGKYLGP